MGGADGTQAVAMPSAATAYTSVAGVRALLDLDQAMAPLVVRGAPSLPVTPFLLGVGATDAASKSSSLEPWLPDPLGTGTSWGTSRARSTTPPGRWRGPTSRCSPRARAAGACSTGS